MKTENEAMSIASTPDVNDLGLRHKTTSHNPLNLCLNFHPDFAINPYPLQPTHVILRASNPADPIHYCASRGALVEQSAFFAGLFSLPQSDLATENKNDISVPAIIETPAASSDALRLFLTAITPGRPTEWLLKAAEGDQDTLFTLLSEALDFLAFIQAGPCVLILAKLFESVPSLHFALAGVLKDEKLAKSASTRLVNTRVSDIPTASLKLLEQRAASYMTRLYLLHERRALGWKESRSLMMGATICDGNQGFARMCKSSCAEATRFKEFNNLRQFIADRIILEAQDDDSLDLSVVVSDIIDRSLSCDLCASRLRRTVINVILCSVPSSI